MGENSGRVATRRGIYLLPNLFTTAAMFAGFYAIVAAFGGRFTAAAIAVFVAAVLDGLDGRIARLTGTQSDFGVQYDSLSDLISFGVAPALVTYVWSMSHLAVLGPFWGKLGWSVAFLYVACAALRLARFNTQAAADKRYFQGLASPAAAGLCMAFVWVASDLGWEGADLMLVTPVLVAITGLLMVSRVRYYSFKAWPRNDRVPFLAIIVAVLILIALAIETEWVLLGLGVLYVLSGPAMTLAGIRTRRRARRRAGSDQPS